jgi:hypothetical protein
MAFDGGGNDFTLRESGHFLFRETAPESSLSEKDQPRSPLLAEGIITRSLSLFVLDSLSGID